MNVKFKMPKFGRDLTGGSMVKELLLTTLITNLDESCTRLELTEADSTPVHYQRKQ